MSVRVRRHSQVENFSRWHHELNQSVSKIESVCISLINGPDYARALGMPPVMPIKPSLWFTAADLGLIHWLKLHLQH